jgi:hypothetical protein
MSLLNCLSSSCRAIQYHKKRMSLNTYMRAADCEPMNSFWGEMNYVIPLLIVDTTLFAAGRLPNVY